MIEDLATGLFLRMVACGAEAESGHLCPPARVATCPALCTELSGFPGGCGTLRAEARTGAGTTPTLLLLPHGPTEACEMPPAEEGSGRKGEVVLPPLFSSVLRLPCTLSVLLCDQQRRLPGLPLLHPRHRKGALGTLSGHLVVGGFRHEVCHDASHLG